MNASISNRLARLEAKGSDAAKGWPGAVRIIVPRGECAEAVQERHFAEHPEDRGKNVVLRTIVCPSGNPVFQAMREGCA
jgi:hypothetical protein